MNYRYGLLTYSTLNIGDYIQSIAARQFLPRVDVYLDRDYLKNVRSKQKIKLIMNGWFLDRPKNWPPSSDIKPLFVSFHIANVACEALTSRSSIEYLKQYEPIGCRDYFTRDLLTQEGVEAYFSGCLTLTLKSNTTERANEILLVDVNGEAIQCIPPSLLERSTVLSHGGNSVTATLSKRLYTFSPALHRILKLAKVDVPLNSLLKFVRSKQERTKRTQRFKEAEALLERYARAKLVITSRLHCALPCLAFGTPVIFVNRNLKDPRFSGYLEYMRSYSVEDFKRKILEIDVENLEPNPKSISKLRENLIKTCENFISND